MAMDSNSLILESLIVIADQSDLASPETLYRAMNLSFSDSARKFISQYNSTHEGRVPTDMKEEVLDWIDVGYGSNAAKSLVLKYFGVEYFDSDKNQKQEPVTDFVPQVTWQIYSDNEVIGGYN